MEYIISTNDRYNSVEIKFSAKPDEETRNALKVLKFRWNRKLGIWYGFATVETVRNALEGGNATEQEQPQQKPSKTATKPNKPDQDHIRIYWNGLKIDGGKLIGCYYHYDPSAETVCISAKNYDHLPRDLFDVTNDTDIYTDYFDTDRATVDASHPLYPFLRYAALKEESRYAVSPVKNAMLKDHKRYYHMDEVGSRIFVTRKEAKAAPGIFYHESKEVNK